MGGGRRRCWTRSLGVPLIAAVLGLQLWPMQATGAASVTVNLTDNAYLPPSLTVKVNDTVTWKVPSSVVGSCHSVSSDDGLFDSGPLAGGLLCLGGGAQSWSNTFTRAGTYRYHCKVVSGMAGVVTVVAPSLTPSLTPTPTPSPSASPSASASPTPPSPSPSTTASPSTSPSRSTTPTATVTQPVVPTTTALAGGTGGSGGSSAATAVAIVAGLIAVACAGALIALRRFGAW